MDRKTVLVAIAALLLAVGLIAGFSGVSVNNGQVNCGSVFRGSDDAQQADFSDEIGGTLVGGTPDATPGSTQAQCRDKVADRKPITYGALGLAALALIAGIAIKEDQPAT